MTWKPTDEMVQAAEFWLDDEMGAVSAALTAAQPLIAEEERERIAKRLEDFGEAAAAGWVRSLVPTPSGDT